MIIGRTRANSDFSQLEFDDFDKKTYYHISHLSRKCLLVCGIKSLPVSLNAIIKHYKICAISYSALQKLNIRVFDDAIRNNQGFCDRVGKDNRVYIFYDATLPAEVQRFTIAHEIGHILLEHFERDTKSREKQASMFAARILMPMAILKECEVKSVEEIQSLCFVSLQAATYRFKRLQKVLKRNKFYTDKNEIQLKQQFCIFINEYLENAKNSK